MTTQIMDPALLTKYGISGPRYTSYPTALQFNTGFNKSDYTNLALSTNGPRARDLSLYFHIPFCAHLCFYCACSKILTKNTEKAVTYLNYLYREIELQSKLFDGDRQVTQLHLGGGTPTFLTTGQIRELVAQAERHFTFANVDERDFSIEIDPRTVTEETVRELRNIGFNRMSIGVQDFDPDVQQAIHRVQSREQTLSVFHTARDIGFRSINVDLIYGLPKQTLEGFQNTIDGIIEMSPDRISLFNYAHMPNQFPAQKRILAAELPSAEAKLAMFTASANALTDAGYEYIGMDHFAKSTDSLVEARDNNKMHRNFQGYSSHGDCDLIGLGNTAIGKVGRCFSQNQKNLEDYYAALDAGQLPVWRGYTLSGEDEIRGDIIERLMCSGTIDITDIEDQYAVNFDKVFKTEMLQLNAMADEKLVGVSNQKIQVLPAGKPIIRAIAMIFDAHLNQANEDRHSKVI